MAATRIGPHELLERLGQGAMGEVWQARDTRTDALVALKILREMAGSRRFRREFRALQRLDHPNVVRVLEMGEDGAGRPWITMELVQGTTLREVIDRDVAGWPPSRHSPEWIVARLSLLHQAALGLAHCHEQGVLHRDLKPTNVLVGDDGVARLADFGLARVDSAPSSLSGAGLLVGTAAYMSPEQARGGAVDARSDVHSLGALMFEVATARPPFVASDLPTLLHAVLFDEPGDPRGCDPQLDASLSELVLQCLAKDPLARPQSAGVVASRLRDIASARGLRLDDGPAPRTTTRLRPHAPQIAGRDEERRRLRDALERSRTRAVTVVVTGRSGVGKSRLARELVEEARHGGFEALASTAPRSLQPLGALRDALSAAARSAPGEVAEDVRLLLAALPELGASDAPRGPIAAIDRMRIAWSAQAVLESWLLAGRRILVLDDLQWADPLSAQVIGELVRSTSPRLLLLLFRDDVESPGGDRFRRQLGDAAPCEGVALAPLDERAVGHVLRSMLGREQAPAVCERVARATEGLPQGVEEVVRELASRGAVEAVDGALQLRLPRDIPALSASDATRRHVESLGATPRRVALAVALAGRALDVATLGRALELEDSPTLDDALDVLVREGLLRDGPAGETVSPVHDRVGEALEAGASTDELRSTRRALARALESAHPASARHEIASLDLAAGSLDDALRTVPPSAEAFAAAGLHALALERLDTLLELAGAAGALPALLRKRRAELLGQSGRTEEAVEAYAALVADESAHAEVKPWDASLAQATLLMLLTRHADGIAVAERAAAMARDAGSASGHARSLSVLATVLDMHGDAERSQRLHDEAVALARRGGERRDLAMALTNLGVGARHHGRLDVASAAYEESAQLFEQEGNALYAANCRQGLAAVLLDRGEPGLALPIARGAVDVMRRQHELRGLSRALEVLGLAAFARGSMDEAEAVMREALAIRSRLDEPWAAGESRLNLARVATWRGSFEAARALLLEAREHFERAGSADRLALVAARAADLAWRARDPDARALAEDALASCDGAGSPLARLELQLTLARLDADDGRPLDACARLRSALATPRAASLAGVTRALESELVSSRALARDVDGLAADAERLLAGQPDVVDRLAAARALRVLGLADRATACLDDARRALDRAASALGPQARERWEHQHLHARLLRREEESEDMSTEDREELEGLRMLRALVVGSDATEPDALLAGLVQVALERLGLERGLVFVEEGGELACRVARDRSGAEIPHAERRVPDQLLRRALDLGEPVLAMDVQGDPSIEWRGSVAEMGIQAFASVPVTTRGGLRLVAHFDGAPPRSDMRLPLRRLAPALHDLGALLDRARLARAKVERADALLSSMSTDGGAAMVGTSRAMDELRRLVRTVAPTDASVLVVGESGTGKELVAKALHAASARRDGPLLSRSCAELTETLLESELFGHERGAFTGAHRDRAGLFEAASGGTLFLDEVGEMSPGLQAKLLRVLEAGEVTRIGSTRSHAIDVRLVAATHRDLHAGVRDGSFRQDLYYRMRVIEVRVPALRDRRQDVPLLAHHFLAQLASSPQGPRTFTHEALRALAQHDWPGNVRELRNAVERAVILSAGAETIGLDLLPPELTGRPTEPATAVAGKDLRAARDAFERACIERALSDCGGNRTHAARALGISLRSLQQKMGRHQVS